MHGLNHNNITQKPLKSFNINRLNFVIPLMATVGLFAGGAAFLNPLSFVDNSYADSKNTAISLRIGESIMLPEVSTDSINIELDPTAADGDFKTASVTVGVSTNRIAGYTLTASVEGSETALTNTDYDNYEIAALSNKTSASDFADLTKTASMNKWGYATDNNGDGDGQTEAGYYYAMPDVDNPTTLKITDGPAATSNTVVTFATKGKDLAAGKYENTVVFTAVGNIEPTPLKNGISMQDATPQMCADSLEFDPNDAIHTSYELVDSRTNEKYWIRKFSDKNCWMVENLYLTDGLQLTPSDSNTQKNTNIPSSGNNYSNGFYQGGRNRNGFRQGTYAADGSYFAWTIAKTGGASGETTDVCPKGWRLFNSNEADGINDVIRSTNRNIFFANTDGAISARIYPGYYENSTLNNKGTSVDWWSNQESAGYSYMGLFMHMESSSTGISRQVSSKERGQSVRCLISSKNNA